ncbi:MAG: hypothetical protein COA71_08750 [SAR86 cluster bacterium]|uniref:Calcineurin-like phosphoesterase domain-containing protein n=1 Tax=SAR86 cluster bacterium TaxID=2030880 RepID=A0A2A5CCN7_9GAMM|nr:metallophosphoesterase [Gammaproteobacteria bacterium AH-315-E17]PCJ41126.1 MAG: hypothetical protein COA71_08750 [SAR86 cluster bacterium]
MNFERIVQITDTHVVGDLGSSILNWDPTIALEDVLADIESLDPVPTRIIATGDLTNDGLVEDYEALKAILLTTDIPVSVMPGNHDLEENLTTSLLNKKIKMEGVLHLNKINWDIVVINSHVPNVHFGRVDERLLKNLQEKLDLSEGKHCLVATHHSLTPECFHETCQFQNAEQLLTLLDNYENVRAVISGHTHCEVEKQHNSIKLLTTPSTLFHVVHHKEVSATCRNGDFMACHDFDETKKGYRILDLYEDGNVVTKIRWV